MRAELRSLHAPDAASGDVGAFDPDDTEDFALLVQALIGPAGDRGEEMFDFTVCTASWLGGHDLPKGFEFPRGTLLVRRWDPELVTRAISDLCLRTEGADWLEVAQKLSRFGKWEFEDYRDEPGRTGLRSRLEPAL